MAQMRKADRARVDLRNDYTMFQLRRQQNQSYTERASQKQIEIKKKEPFKHDVYVDMYDEDTLTYFYQPSILDVENKKITKALNDLKIIKDQSVLDLSELIRKHTDKQPQLLAMLQPDLKRNLLYNPALMKSIDQLER